DGREGFAHLRRRRALAEAAPRRCERLEEGERVLPPPPRPRGSGSPGPPGAKKALGGAAGLLRGRHGAPRRPGGPPPARGVALRGREEPARDEELAVQGLRLGALAARSVERLGLDEAALAHDVEERCTGRRCLRAADAPAPEDDVRALTRRRDELEEPREP